MMCLELLFRGRLVVEQILKTNGVRVAEIETQFSR